MAKERPSNVDRRDHWDRLGRNYLASWTTAGKRNLSRRELGHIANARREAKAQSVLDIGVGGGRILASHLADEQVEQVWGVDFAQEMVRTAHERFGRDPRLRLGVHDLSTGLPHHLNMQFDLITAIRVFKYVENWRELVRDAHSLLAPGGILLFTIPNARSVNWFARYRVPMARATVTEVGGLVTQAGLELIGVTTFTRLPDLLYDAAKSERSASVLQTAEYLLGRALGPTLFGRILFVMAHKQPPLDSV